MREAARENDKRIQEITAEAMERLISYNWPGNVRELRSAIERAVVLTRTEKISSRDLPPELRSESLKDARPRGELIAHGEITVKEAEKQLISRALKESGGSRTEAAKKLGMSRRTLHRKLHAYHLENS
jgi:two-component system response regulator HydG